MDLSGDHDHQESHPLQSTPTLLILSWARSYVRRFLLKLLDEIPQHVLLLQNILQSTTMEHGGHGLQVIND